MNQGKLEVVKQEMARVDIDILGISELKWTGWVNLTEMTLNLLLWARISLKTRSSPHSQHKNLKNSTWVQSQN